MELLILTFMILGHLIADYCLQGWLATAKQKKYWEQFDDVKYKNDWIPALICHSTMWAIIVFIPLFTDLQSVYDIGWFWLALPINIAIHFIVDDLKANKLKINLWQDQLLHLIQIVLTWLVWIIIY